MAVINVYSGNSVKETIIKEIGNAQLDVLELDLSSMASVQNFASNFKFLNVPLNILINNAGIMASPFQLSQDGIELQFATNHIGESYGFLFYKIIPVFDNKYILVTVINIKVYN